jgi:hypothetical protein
VPTLTAAMGAERQHRKSLDRWEPRCRIEADAAVRRGCRLIAASRATEQTVTELSPEIRETLDRLEEEQRERYRPKPPQERQTPAEAFAKRLAAARTETISVDSG